MYVTRTHAVYPYSCTRYICARFCYDCTFSLTLRTLRVFVVVLIVCPIDCCSENHFRLSYYPHRLVMFNKLLDDVFGQSILHEVHGDFKPLGAVDKPAYFVHVVQC